MADQPPIVPPFRKPVSLFKTPDQTIIFVTELVNRDDPAYVQNAPVKRGTLYKDIVGGNQQISDTHPLLYFCRELQYQQSDQYVIWEWSSDEQAHSSYNADITYELEDAGFPVFTRTYTIRRDEYEQNPTIAIGSTLAALIGVTIVDGGQDYTYATGEIENKGATVTFVVSDGVIISGVVTNEGSGVVAGDTITITGDGGNASVIPMVQPTSAVLTSQKKEELPPDNPWANEFVKVTRVYQTLPGPTIHSTQLHVDGVVVDVATTVKVASTIVSGETLVGTTWTITTKTQEDNDYIGKEIVITRQVPGNDVPYTHLEDDGKTLTGTRTLTDTTLCVTTETLATGVWTKKYKEFLTTRLTIGEEASDKVSWQIVESRPIPGNDMVKTTIDADGDTVTETRTMVAGPPTLVTTITTAGGVYTKTFGEPISELVSWKVVQVKATQNALPSYEVEIPDLIPSIFTGLLPITTTEAMVIGVASAPTLATGDLMRRQAQVNYNTYRLTIRGRAGLSLPQSITVSRQTSEEYGGEILKTTGYLNSMEPAVESGLGIVSSTVKNLGNGTFFRETTEWDVATSWPLLTEYDQDPETQALITTTYQVIDATTVVAPSIVNGVITRYKKIDRWRSMEIIETYSLPDDYDEQRFMAHTFPSLWDYTIYNYSTACGPTGPIRHGFASMVQARLHISFTTSKDTIAGLVIQPNTIRLVQDVINAVLNDAGTITYVGTCVGPITFPASSPDFTTYTTTIQGSEQLISGESVLWRAGLYKNSRLYVVML